MKDYFFQRKAGFKSFFLNSLDRFWNFYTFKSATSSKCYSVNPLYCIWNNNALKLFTSTKGYFSYAGNLFWNNYMSNLNITKSSPPHIFHFCRQLFHLQIYTSSKRLITDMSYIIRKFECF